MKKMNSLVAISLSCAVFCGAWTVLADKLGLVSWAGFAGCTTYFASGKHGFLGLKKTIIPNMTGVLCGMLIIILSDLVPALGEIGVWCGIASFVMCIITKYELVDFCPGTFVGCFTTFAIGGNWKQLVVALICGAFLGFVCDLGGVVLQGDKRAVDTFFKRC